MRALLCLMFVLVGVVSAVSGDWTRFGIKHFGFVFDVPPGFTLASRSKSGDGAIFSGPARATLLVGGIETPRSKFRSQIKRRMDKDSAEGWEITYKRLTSGWVSYSGTKAGQIRYFRAIAICDDRAAIFRMDYSRTEKRAYDPIVTRMVRSLKPEGC